MAGTTIAGFQDLIDNITKQAKEIAEKGSYVMANKFTGTNIPELEKALITAEAAEDQVEKELLEHIRAQEPDDQKNYYRTINTRKKDIILSDLQRKYDRNISAIESGRDLLAILEGSPNVTAADYYRLKNKDITEKIADISALN